MTINAHHSDNGQLGDVGHGVNFGADLFYLFRAGKAHIPATATEFADSARELHQVTSILDSLAATTGERAMRHVAALREDVHFALHRTATNMNATANAVVDTAKEYARSDEAALAAFRAYRNDPSENEALQDPPAFDPPPRPGDPAETSTYGRPGQA